MRVPQEGSGQVVLGLSIKTLLALFYANDILVVKPDSAFLQR